MYPAYLERGRSARLERPGAPLFVSLPDSSLRGPMIEELKQKLGDEVQRLQHELNVVLPNEIRKAVELGDLRENSEYKAALERQQFVQARLGQLRQRLSKLSQIDIAQIPNDKVGLGSRVVVEDQATKVLESYSLVFGDSVEFEDGHVSMGSPIGRALVGKAVGDDILLKLPAVTRRLRIIELITIHQAAAQ
jgi:transcription elongation factor GreA